MTERPNYGATLFQFYDSKGALEITFHIGHGGASYTTLDDEIAISPKTLSDRLKEGEELDLWTTIAKRENDGRSKQKYVMTKTGLQVVKILEEANFSEAYTRYLNRKEELETVRNQVLDVIKKYDSEISQAKEASQDIIKDQESSNEITPPWIEPSEPTAEAYESIGELDQKRAAHNPFEHATTEANMSSQESEDMEKQFNKLIDEFAESIPEDLSPEELIEQYYHETSKEDE